MRKWLELWHDLKKKKEEENITHLASLWNDGLSNYVSHHPVGQCENDKVLTIDKASVTHLMYIIILLHYFYKEPKSLEHTLL